MEGADLFFHFPGLSVGQLMGVPVAQVLFVAASLGQALIVVENNGADDVGAPDPKSWHYIIYSYLRRR